MKMVQSMSGGKEVDVSEKGAETSRRERKGGL